MTQPPKADAITAATGIPWTDWCALLDEGAGPSLPHDRIATRACDYIIAHAAGMPASTNPEWWGQSVAVAYEQQIGRRVPGQSSSGDFHVGASKTYPGDLDATLEAWLDLVGDRDSFDGVPVEGEARVSSTQKWRYWRINLADGSRVSVDIGRKATEKSTIGINHTRLDSAESMGHWRGVWRGILAGLS
ncbi:hypothetical protein [Arthrobacter sp. JSM 101049]|uniref:hypothetical protein n=1 Tax=Arthrobacter sp. JSM 101049 TaxID=929097 RepID=UPI003563ED1F